MFYFGTHFFSQEGPHESAYQIDPPFLAAVPVATLSAGLFFSLPAQRIHAGGATLYVAPGGQTSGACNSWANACELGYALASAVSGQELWVVAGRYTPTSGTNRNLSFHLKAGVAVYGGFAGTETVRDQRDLAVNVATLSGT